MSACPASALRVFCMPAWEGGGAVEQASRRARRAMRAKRGRGTASSARPIAIAKGASKNAI